MHSYVSYSWSVSAFGLHVCSRDRNTGQRGVSCLTGSCLFVLFCFESVLLRLSVSFIFNSQTVTQNDTEGRPRLLETAHPRSPLASGIKGLSACRPRASLQVSRPVPHPLASPMSKPIAGSVGGCSISGRRCGPPAHLSCVSPFPRVLWLRLCPQASALVWLFQRVPRAGGERLPQHSDLGSRGWQASRSGQRPGLGGRRASRRAWHPSLAPQGPCPPSPPTQGPAACLGKEGSYLSGAVIGFSGSHGPVASPGGLRVATPHRFHP